MSFAIAIIPTFREELADEMSDIGLSFASHRLSFNSCFASQSDFKIATLISALVGSLR